MTGTIPPVDVGCTVVDPAGAFCAAVLIADGWLDNGGVSTEGMLLGVSDVETGACSGADGIFTCY